MGVPGSDLLCWGYYLDVLITCGKCSTDPCDPRPLPTYLLERYSRCLSRKWCPTNMRACSIAIPSARSLSYTVRNASELILPRRRSVASSSVKGAEVSSTLLVFGLYQCIRNAPFPFPEAHLNVYLREVFTTRALQNTVPEDT